MGLTKNQKDELNKAILEYLYANGYQNAYDAFVIDAEVNPDEETGKPKNILEAKWKSVAKLKRQVLGLEDQIKRYKEENDVAAISGPQKEGLPKQPEKHLLLGHKDKVTKVIFHPLYDMLASSSDDASIKLWDTETGENEKTMRGHTKKINCIAFNNQGTFMGSCSMDMSIKLWNLEVSQCVKTLKGHEHNISNVKFMPAGDQIVSCSWDKTLKVWDCNSGYCLKTFEGHEDRVMNLDINAAGTRMVSCSKRQEIIYWDLNLKSDRPILNIFDEEHENVIDVVVFAPIKTAKTIIKARMEQENEGDEQTGGEDAVEESKVKDDESNGDKDKSKLSNLTKRSEELRALKEKMAVLKNRTKASKTNTDVEEDKKEESTDIEVKDEFVASGSRDKRIKIWNAKRGACIINCIGHDGWVNDIVFHPNGKYMLSASDDKSVRIWDLEKNGVCIKKMLGLHDNFISSLAISRKAIATGSVDKKIKVFELR